MDAIKNFLDSASETVAETLNGMNGFAIYGLAALWFAVTVFFTYKHFVKQASTGWLDPRRKFAYMVEDEYKNDGNPQTVAFFRKATKKATISSVVTFIALTGVTLPTYLDGNYAVLPSIVTAISLFTFLGVFATISDFKTLLMPYDSFTPFYASLAPLALIGWLVTGVSWLNILLWSILPIMLWLIALFKVGGHSDIRLLAVTVLTFAWWLDPIYSLIALGVSAVTGLTAAIYYGTSEKFKKKIENMAGDVKLQKRKLLQIMPPANITLIQKQILEGKASSEAIKEWKMYKLYSQSTSLPYGPHIVMGWLGAGIAGLLITLFF